MFVLNVFDFGGAKGEAIGIVSSATEPKTCRRKGFHRDVLLVLVSMVADAGHHALLYDRCKQMRLMVREERTPFLLHDSHEAQ